MRPARMFWKSFLNGLTMQGPIGPLGRAGTSTRAASLACGALSFHGYKGNYTYLVVHQHGGAAEVLLGAGSLMIVGPSILGR
jgi:hypothetical protein